MARFIEAQLTPSKRSIFVRNSRLDSLRGLAALCVLVHHAFHLSNAALVPRLLDPALPEIPAPDVLGRVIVAATNGGMAIAGIVLGVLSILIAAAVVAIGASFLGSETGGSLIECLTEAGSDEAAQAACEQEFRNEVEGG